MRIDLQKVNNYENQLTEGKIYEHNIEEVQKLVLQKL